MNWNVPPEVWIAAASVALTLVVSAAHRRGHRVPMLELLLDLVHGTSRPAPVTSDQILAELKKRLPLPGETQ